MTVLVQDGTLTKGHFYRISRSVCVCACSLGNKFQFYKKKKKKEGKNMFYSKISFIFKGKVFSNFTLQVYYRSNETPILLSVEIL